MQENALLQRGRKHRPQQLHGKIDDETLDNARVGDKSRLDTGLMDRVVLEQILTTARREHVMEKVFDILVARVIAQRHCQQSHQQQGHRRGVVKR